MEKVLVTGISGGQGRLLARRLLDSFEVCGVDRVAWEGRPKDVNVHQVDLRKRKFEDVFRTEQPTAVVHMGMVRQQLERSIPARHKDRVFTLMDSRANIARYDRQLADAGGGDSDPGEETDQAG